MYTDAKVTIDLEEYMQLKATIERLSKPAEGTELTESEHQEATGLLLTRALENPGLFRQAAPDIQLGKFRAIFAIDTTVTRHDDKSPRTVMVKFVRT